MSVDKKGRKLPKGIRQRGQNYECRIMYEGRSYSVLGRTVTETQKKATELKYKLEHGVFVSQDKITVQEWYETWMREYKKNRVKLSTYNSYQKYYNMAIKGRFGKKQLGSIRGEHIQKMYNDLIEEGYALSTIKIIAAVLNGCFKQGVKNGLIDRNPVILAELPRQTKKSTRVALTKEQQAIFMEYAKESYLYNYFAVMLRTGLRNGEMRGLKYSDIDKKNNILHVQRTLNYIEGRGYIEDTPKTMSSKRDIPIMEDTMQLLNDQKDFWGFKVDKIDRYLFCNEVGEPMSRARVQSEIDRIVSRIQEAGYAFDRITPHVFRHTFATRAIEAGMQPQVLKAILGHSSLAMTMDLYGHVLPDIKTQEMEKLINVF